MFLNKMSTKNCSMCGVNENFYLTSSYCKESHRLYCRQYNKINTKDLTYYRWVKQDIRFKNYKHFEKVYEIYIKETHCQLCNKEFKGTKKCLDHHHPTGVIRWICCQTCNIKLGKVDRVHIELSRFYFRNLE